MGDTSCFVEWPIDVKEPYRVFQQFFQHAMLTGEFVVDKQGCCSWVDHGCYFSGTVSSFQIARNMEVGFTTTGFGNSYRVNCCIRIHHLRHCYMWSNWDTCTTNVHLIQRCRWWSRDRTRHRKMGKRLAISEKSVSLLPNLQTGLLYTFGTRLSETWLEKSVIPEIGESAAAIVDSLSKKMLSVLQSAHSVLLFAPLTGPVSLLVPYYLWQARVL